MIYTPYATLNHVHHDNYYEIPKPEPPFEKRVELWNERLRNKTAREIIKSAVSDCEDKGMAFFRVVFIIASIIYLIGSAAAYVILSNKPYEFAAFFIFIGSLLAGFITAVIIGGAKMDIMTHKLRKRADTLYERYEAYYEEERNRMVSNFRPEEYQTVLEKNMIVDKMTIDEFRDILHSLTSDAEM